jgi:hypothetical protein
MSLSTKIAVTRRPDLSARNGTDHGLLLGLHVMFDAHGADFGRRREKP